jgi:hypothetical protein
MKKPKCPLFYAFTVKGKLKPVRCGSWACRYCAKRLALEWAKRARLHIANSGADYYFITLTLGSGYNNPKMAFKGLPKIWDAIRKWVQRAIGKSERWDYLAFVEGQPQRGGMPHFHILSSLGIGALATQKQATSARKRYLRRRKIRIKDWAVARSVGFQADERIVNGSQAASYVAKYATKQHPVTPKGFRRVRATQSWAKLPEWSGDALLVKAFDETLTHYLERVSDVTGIGMQELLDIWQSHS